MSDKDADPRLAARQSHMDNMAARQSYMDNMAAAFAAAGLPLPTAEQQPAEPTTDQLKIILKTMVKPYDPTKNYFAADHVFYKNSIWQPVIKRNDQQVIEASSIPPDENDNWKKVDTSNTELPDHVREAFISVIDEMSSPLASNSQASNSQAPASQASNSQASNSQASNSQAPASQASNSQASNSQASALQVSNWQAPASQASNSQASNLNSSNKYQSQINDARDSFFRDMTEAYKAEGLSPPGAEAESNPSPTQLKNIFKAIIKPFNPNKNYYSEELTFYNNNFWKAANGLPLIKASPTPPDENTDWERFNSSGFPEDVRDAFTAALNEMSSGSSSATILKEKIDIVQANIAKTTTNAQALANVAKTFGGRRKTKSKVLRKTKRKVLRKAKTRR